MKNISILNDVLGPVMRGPSSSHTAGSYHLAALARSLLGERPTAAQIAFDPAGSYAKVYREQGSDLAFGMGLLGWPITDSRFPAALDLAPREELDVRFTTQPIAEDGHPNAVLMHLTGERGRRLTLRGRSIGGGAVEITALDGWPVLLDGSAPTVLVEATEAAVPVVLAAVTADGQSLGHAQYNASGLGLLVVRRTTRLAAEVRRSLECHSQIKRIWQADPLMFAKRGQAMLCSATEMAELAEAKRLSAGQVGAQYEAALLGLSESEVAAAMAERLDVMLDAVRRGLQPNLPPMQLLAPSAGRVYQAEAEGRLAVGGMHTRAAARALAAMHVNCGMGVVCAAPTAGSAGVLPAVMATLCKERGVSRDTAVRCLFAAGLVGAIVAERATFAAEVAGCQVEIGAAGAMAAAAVMEAAGGTARQAADAAAVCFQNTMGSVCDLVQGIVEIPCHTRNAVAASAAFVVADLILGGYGNAIPLDETIDAVYAVGRMLPAELRVTSLGGLAITPSAQALRRR